MNTDKDHLFKWKGLTVEDRNFPLSIPEETLIIGNKYKVSPLFKYQYSPDVIEVEFLGDDIIKKGEELINTGVKVFKHFEGSDGITRGILWLQWEINKFLIPLNEY